MTWREWIWIIGILAFVFAGISFAIIKIIGWLIFG